MKKTRKISRNKLFGWLALLELLFIWGNSMIVAEISGNTSGKLTKIIYELIKILFEIEASFGTLHFFIRKLAHFTEYAVYGFLIKGYGKFNWILTLIIGLTTAGIDEMIQYFTPGRSCEIRDVMIDFSGFIFGIISYWILRAIWHELENTIIKKYKEKMSKGNI